MEPPPPCGRVGEGWPRTRSPCWRGGHHPRTIPVPYPSLSCAMAYGKGRIPRRKSRGVVTLNRERPASAVNDASSAACRGGNGACPRFPRQRAAPKAIAAVSRRLRPSPVARMDPATLSTQGVVHDHLFFSIVTNAPVLATLLGFIVLMVAVLLHHVVKCIKINQVVQPPAASVVADSDREQRRTRRDPPQQQHLALGHPPNSSPQVEGVPSPLPPHPANMSMESANTVMEKAAWSWQESAMGRVARWNPPPLVGRVWGGVATHREAAVGPLAQGQCWPRWRGKKGGTPSPLWEGWGGVVSEHKADVGEGWPHTRRHVGERCPHSPAAVRRRGTLTVWMLAIEHPAPLALEDLVGGADQAELVVFRFLERLVRIV